MSKKVGEAIKRAREKKGWSQARLSLELGPNKRGEHTPASTISRWENGHQVPERRLRQLALVLDLSLEELTEEPEESPVSRLAAELGLSRAAVDEFVRKFGREAIDRLRGKTAPEQSETRAIREAPKARRKRRNS